MLHVVPILCLILFIGLVEYRLKKHLDEIDIKILKLESFHKTEMAENRTNKFIVFLNREVNKLITAGYANGYVAIYKDHPYFGKDYMDINVDIHGGLTFSKSGKYFTFVDTECLEGCVDQLSEDWWIFGFDTCHSGDNLTTWPKDKVIDEVIKLKTILEEKYNG